MDKQRLTQIIRQPESATESEYKQLKMLAAQHPYANIIHVLNAKISTIKGLASKDIDLQKAAISITDRALLKRFLQDGKWIQDAPIKQPATTVKPAEPAKVQEPSQEVAAVSTNKSEATSKEVFDEVYQNLEKLKSLTSKYKFLESKEQKSFLTELSKPSVDQQAPEEKEVGDTSLASKPKEEQAAEVAEEATENAALANEFQPDSEDTNELLGEQTSADDTEGDADADREKELRDKIEKQGALIENFIKLEEEIVSKRPKAQRLGEGQQQKDLSEPSSTFNEDIASENLAAICASQGKTERAINIYRKLIWKYPQKKAYFAARIEELKNS